MTREHVVNEPRPVATETPVKRVRLEVVDQRKIQIADLPISPETLATVARAVQNGRSFSHSSLSGRGKPLTRGEFEELRDWLLTAGYAQWADDANRRAGVSFTAKGKALLRGLAF